MLTRHDIAISLYIQYDRDTQVTKLLKRDVEVLNFSAAKHYLPFFSLPVQSVQLRFLNT